MNASKRINPFFYHRLSKFEYKGNTKYFHPAFKLAFAYLASLQNKWGRLTVKPESLNATLGLDGSYGPNGEFIMWWFWKVGIIRRWTIPATLFEDSYSFSTLHEVSPEEFTERALAQEAMEELV